MKSSTWLLNRKLYFHMKRQLQKSPAFKMNLSLCESCGPRPSATG